VRLVVLGEEELALVAAELAPERVAGEELSFSHTGIAVRNEFSPFGATPRIVLENALELQQRLVVEADVVEVLHAEAALAKTVRDRVMRELLVVLLAREALFLRRGDELAVAHEAGRGVVVVGGESENRRHVRTVARSGDLDGFCSRLIHCEVLRLQRAIERIAEEAQMNPTGGHHEVVQAR
jgi:hypothetical protein